MTALPLPEVIRRPLRRIYHSYLNSHAVKSYSQEGEDMILRRIFGNRTRGFYVDVGAHHPRRFSNTCYFYRQGWQGINIEPNPEGHALLTRARKRDINLLCGISDREGELDYHMFEEPALNTLDADSAARQSAASRLVETRKIQVRRLESVLDEHLPPGTRIDFMNIDVEGHDLNVLKSGNWDKYRPRVVIAEAIGTSLEEVLDSELAKFMRDAGYALYAKTVNSVFFMAR